MANTSLSTRSDDSTVDHPVSSGPVTRIRLGEKDIRNWPTVRALDMEDEDMKYEALSLALEAEHQFSSQKDIAGYIKKGMDEKYGPTWHCIVGTDFGSYITHEGGHFIYFEVRDEISVLLFKTV